MITNESNKIIWVDFDEVLAESFDCIFNYYNYELNWKAINKKILKHNYIFKMREYNISYEESVDWYRKPLFVEHHCIKPVKGAKSFIKKYKDKWFKFKVITARPENLFKNLTISWIENNFKWLFDEVIFANHDSDNSKDKSEICRENFIEIMIEDNPDYALELAQNWIKTFLLEKAWNKDIKISNKNIIRVKNWKDIIL